MEKKRPIYLLLFLGLVFLGLGLESCDSRKSFLNEISLGIPDSILNEKPKISFSGDSLKKIEANNSLKLKFKLTIDNALDNEQFSIVPEMIEGQGKLYLNSKEIRYNVTQNRLPKENEFEFEPNEREIGVYEINFIVTNYKGLQSEASIRLRYVDDIASIEVDRSGAIDNDSAKVGTNYDFQVTVKSNTYRKVKFDGNIFDFFEIKPDNTLDNISNKELIFQPNEKKSIRAVARLTSDFLSQNTPFIHKSYPAIIRVLVLSRLDNNPEVSSNFVLTVFDNLPPLAPKISITYRRGSNPIFKSAEVSYTEVIDRDSKWGGTATVRFVGYQGEQEIRNAFNELLGWGQRLPNLAAPLPQVGDCLPYQPLTRNGVVYEYFGYAVPPSPVLIPQAPSYFDLYTLSSFTHNDTTYHARLPLSVDGYIYGTFPFQDCMFPCFSTLPFEAKFVSVDNDGAFSEITRKK